MDKPDWVKAEESRQKERGDTTDKPSWVVEAEARNTQANKLNAATRTDFCQLRIFG